MSRSAAVCVACLRIRYSNSQEDLFCCVVNGGGTKQISIYIFSLPISNQKGLFIRVLDIYLICNQMKDYYVKLEHIRVGST